jgi:hypothetical protein
VHAVEQPGQRHVVGRHQQRHDEVVLLGQVAGEHGLQGAGAGRRQDRGVGGLQVADQRRDDAVFVEHPGDEQLGGRQIGGGRIQGGLLGVRVRQQFLVQPRGQVVADRPHPRRDAGLGGVDESRDVAGQGGSELAVVADDGLCGLLVGDGVGL